VAGPSGRTGPKRWAGPIWLLELKQRKNLFSNFKLNFGIWQGVEILYKEF
jgi:hypothetical protein